jgi:hypothetical protein
VSGFVGAPEMNKMDVSSLRIVNEYKGSFTTELPRPLRISLSARAHDSELFYPYGVYSLARSKSEKYETTFFEG